jgi:FKBP-type peptidyl-prolyl cis-trans isomerase SlyD
MDFNHPMAGLDLFFSGKIVDVREATENELAATIHSCSGCGTGEHSGCGTGEHSGCGTEENSGCSGNCG